MTAKEKKAILKLINSGVMDSADIAKTEAELFKDGEMFVIDGNNQYSIVPRTSATPSTTTAPSPNLSITPQDPLYQAIALFQQALNDIQNQGGVNPTQVNSIIKTYLGTEKVQRNELSDDVLQFINDNKPYLIETPELGIRGGETIFPEPITSLILSDLYAQNNVYLYGGAGTGKSYIAEQIGKELLNCEVYTLPCNQYTSPLDLIGGQTIDGYQEGIVTRAYGNLDVPPSKSGALLLLDELPKLDPNTAGVLNDMLAKIKRGGDITNGRQEKISKGKAIYIVATGNILLNREDPSYGGNNKQDLSLQDRFAGSCYEFIIELKSERSSMMGYLFIWNYLTKLRFEIMEKRFDNFAFVSRRLMESLRDTHAFYMAQKKSIPTADQKKFQAKTIIQGLESFFDLFLDTQKQALKADTNYDAFKISAVQAMNRPDGQEFVDTTQEIEESDRLVALYMTQQLSKYAYLKPMG